MLVDLLTPYGRFLIARGIYLKDGLARSHDQNFRFCTMRNVDGTTFASVEMD